MIVVPFLLILGLYASCEKEEEIKVNSYQVEITSGPNGEVLPRGIVTVMKDSALLISIKPNSGFRRDSVFVDGKLLPVITDEFSIMFVIFVKHKIHTTFVKKEEGTSARKNILYPWPSEIPIFTIK